MKKFLVVLSIILLLVIWYLLYTLNQVNNKLLASDTWDYGTIISQLENELSIKSEEISALQSENQQLKDSLSSTDESLNSLWDDTTNTTNDEWSDSNTTTTTTANDWKEVWIIKQLYSDANWNRKLEIDYVQLRWYGENGCEYPLCIVNENSKLRTFTVSDNVEVIMKTLDYTKPTTISYDYLYQIFNTNNYSEYEYLRHTIPNYYRKQYNSKNWGTICIIIFFIDKKCHSDSQFIGPKTLSSKFRMAFLFI